MVRLRLVLIGVCVALGGCTQQVYRAETVIHPEGLIDRAVFQPFSDTPEAARQPGEWSMMTRADERPAERWSEPISSLPFSDDAKKPYFAASGRYSSFAALPQHLKIGDSESSRGTLTRKLTQTDYHLAVEYVWEETLVEDVTLPAVLVAGRSLAGLARKLALETLREHLGPDCDTRELDAWLVGEGREWLEELTIAYFETCSRTDDRRFKLEWALGNVCERHGLQILDGQQLVKPNVLEDRLRAFLRSLLSLRLRRAGEPLPAETIEELVEGLVPSKPVNEESPPPVRQALDRAILRSFGSREEFEKQFAGHVMQITGVFGWPVLTPPRKFHYSVRVPGRVVETNGRILTEDEVDWTFEAVEAYPRGLTMRVRSLVARSGIQKTLFARTAPIPTRNLVEVVSLLSRDADLNAALKASATAGNLTALQTLKAEVRAGNDTQGLDRLSRFESLLDITIAP